MRVMRAGGNTGVNDLGTIRAGRRPPVNKRGTRCAARSYRTRCARRSGCTGGTLAAGRTRITLRACSALRTGGANRASYSLNALNTLNAPISSCTCDADGAPLTRGTLCSDRAAITSWSSRAYCALRSNRAAITGGAHAATLARQPPLALDALRAAITLNTSRPAITNGSALAVCASDASDAIGSGRALKTRRITNPAPIFIDHHIAADSHRSR